MKCGGGGEGHAGMAPARERRVEAVPKAGENGGARTGKTAMGTHVRKLDGITGRQGGPGQHPKSHRSKNPITSSESTPPSWLKSAAESLMSQEEK